MYCPPLGLTDKFNVTVVGADWTWTGGIAYIERHASISPSQLFHLMLRRSQDDGDTNNMDHLRFECLSKNSPLIEEDKGKGWEYVSLYEHTLFEYYSRTKQESGANRQAYRCALYETIANNPDALWMAIGERMYVDQLTKCDGLSKMMEYGPDPSLKQYQWAGGSMLLFLNRAEIELPPRKKRSMLSINGCRFPDWSQGTWSGLLVDEDVAYYTKVSYDEDDVDFIQENDSELVTTTIHYQYDETNKSSNYVTAQQENIQRVKRSSTQQNEQCETIKFTWHCMMPVVNSENEIGNEFDAKFLTYGGFDGGTTEKYDSLNSNDKNNRQESFEADITEDSTMTFGCLWLELKGREMLFSIIRTGVLEKEHDLKIFAQQLCSMEKNDL
ncbi:uncharacterized protein LOC112592253 [Melanaphis sacchari]|uniref:uncharacterized protein LOC112592253 n=1 Tax=Melanaphis sacchari TaxID=742174 RepID=UPI000DC1337F|nr:uncharacterized protein LOC112592253 [Melanaphis sacchari]